MNDKINFKVAFSPSEAQWFNWIHAVETALNIDADGDFDRDGYSIDTFCDMWKSGVSVDAAVAKTRETIKTMAALNTTLSALEAFTGVQAASNRKE